MYTPVCLAKKLENEQIILACSLKFSAPNFAQPLPNCKGNSIGYSLEERWGWGGGREREREMRKKAR